MPAVDSSSISPFSARQRLVDAAVELFATRGFQAISLRDLAGHVGLHAGSLYHHIENKEGLLFELIESALSDLQATTEHCLSGAKNPAERLHRFVQAFVSFTLNEKDRLVLVTREFVNLNEEHKHQADQLKNNYRTLLYEIIADECGVQNKLDSKTRLITSAIIGMLYGQLQWNEVEITEQHLTELLTDCVLRIIASTKEGESIMI
jgi:AcrR family transcriptional regulator